MTTANQRGIENVGLMSNGIQYKRAVGPLVAVAFLPDPRNDAFDSLINLNGDRMDNGAYNIAWRPRWFAIKYMQQFQLDINDTYCPIENIMTGERFSSPWEAAMRYGIMRVDIQMAIHAETRVWPHMYKFRTIQKL